MSKIPEAITIMKTRGWAQGFISETPRPYECMHTALTAAHLDSQTGVANSCAELTADLAAVAAVRREQYPELTAKRRGDLPAIWATNDAPGQTFDKCEQLMEKAYINRMSAL